MQCGTSGLRVSCEVKRSLQKGFDQSSLIALGIGFECKQDAAYVSVVFAVVDLLIFSAPVFWQRLSDYLIYDVRLGQTQMPQEL